MLAVLLAPVVGELVEPFALGPSAVLQLKQQMEKMRASMGAPQPTRAVNPCFEDMKRFKCADTACLKANAETLMPSCAVFLLGAPEPSPAPAPMREREPRSMSIRLGSEPQVLSPARAPETNSPRGFFSVTTSGPGGSHTYNGFIGPHGALSSGPRVTPSATVQTVARPSLAQMAGAVGPMAMPGFSSMLDMLLPPELAILSSPVLVELEDEEPDEEVVSQHPCAREVSACTHETHTTSRDAIEACLVKHFTQLSRECQCFVHHVTNGRTSQPQPAAVVRTVPVVATARPVPLSSTHHDDVHHPPPPSAGYHRLSCLVVFTTLFLATFLLVRACVITCCAARRARRVVLVPPEQTSIRTIEPHPMLIADLKSPQVQVAEPYRKA